MKTLLLLRHAKAVLADGRTPDHERTLNRRGERAAALMADHIVATCPRPDLILCSTATRTRQTLAPLVAHLHSPSPPIALEKSLYLASEGTLLGRVRDLPDEAGTVLLIGHNDGVWQLAEVLAGHGKATAMAALHDKYPTGTLATLQVPIDHWRDLLAGGAELTGFVCPRDLGVG